MVQICTGDHVPKYIGGTRLNKVFTPFQLYTAPSGYENYFNSLLESLFSNTYVTQSLITHMSFFIPILPLTVTKTFSALNYVISRKHFTKYVGGLSAFAHFHSNAARYGG